MATARVFVPEYVNVDAIDKCFCDRFVTFEQVDSSTFSAEGKHAEHVGFYYLEKDHFVVHGRGCEPLKCRYSSRNLVMSTLRWGWINATQFKSKFPEVDGLHGPTGLPMHYFVNLQNANCLESANATEDNTIVEYFDNDDEIDLAKFASIVKSKTTCVANYFIVNSENVYTAVETSNIENTCKFSSALKYTIISSLANGEATIQTYIDEDKYLACKRPNPKRLPDFTLRDADGNEVADGVEFALEIVRDKESDSELDSNSEYDDNDEEDGNGGSENTLAKLFACKDWLEVGNYTDDTHDYLFGAVDNGSFFYAEMADGIVYLKHEGDYLFSDPKTEIPNIYAGAGHPPKEHRIQIHYTTDGYISLTRWAGDCYCVCDWIKASYGAVSFDPSEWTLRWRDPMKLRIGKAVGFVPTMGALHAGHLNLVAAAAEQTESVVVSIFVNPAQFAPHEDLDQYPRTLGDDVRKLSELGRPMAVFAPPVSEMYPRGISTNIAEQRGTFVEVRGMSEMLEGGTRPHFFRGVATVVAKLFHITMPDIAFFGQKDIQQCCVLRAMVQDLHFPLKIKVVPTVRDPHTGLALSSRNVYLTNEQRARAPAFYRGLCRARDLFASGAVARDEPLAAVRDEAAKEQLDIEYVCLSSPDDLGEVQEVGSSGAILSGAWRMGATRLIDNILLGFEL
ncbi:pantoate-beta-alanine ligase [Coemansia biformis]|uniref:Pantoate--beta-alanine ligase n=1 Tax=Coemansia biformis TaxID=1286918 RepID=A0A9W8CWZ9_9FUNG|nr:pantoate-beta-alanine ligase [Coemansia biformis]